MHQLFILSTLPPRILLQGGEVLSVNTNFTEGLLESLLSSLLSSRVYCLKLSAFVRNIPICRISKMLTNSVKNSDWIKSCILGASKSLPKETVSGSKSQRDESSATNLVTTKELEFDYRHFCSVCYLLESGVWISARNIQQHKETTTPRNVHKVISFKRV